MRVGSCYVGVVVVVVSCVGGCKVKRFKRKWQNIYYPLCARGTSNESFSNCLAVCYQLSNPPVFGTTWKDLGDVIIERQEWMCSTLCCTWIVRFCWGEAEGHIQRMAKPFLGCSHLLGDANFHLMRRWWVDQETLCQTYSSATDALTHPVVSGFTFIWPTGNFINPTFWELLADFTNIRRPAWEAPHHRHHPVLDEEKEQVLFVALVDGGW